jgi:crotonobetainyl-CoA:carnitine CoA-transferase CaiB-like acyl-CoA transferase
VFDMERAGPLTGYRVIELASTAAGPVCGRMMADAGAEVIKVEPFTGDPIRTSGKQNKGKGLYAASLLRNKDSIAVNLKSPEGQEIVKTLAKDADVVIQNFLPGKLDEWGIGYKDLSAINPALVMVSISGYGQSGPLREKRGYGVICEAYSGLRHIIGDPDRPPARVAMAMTDYITGIYGAMGAMMAVINAKDTGKGQEVDLALYEAAFSLLETHVPSYEQLGAIVNRVGPALPDSVVNNLYQSRDGVYLHVQGSQDRGFARLVTAIGRADMAEDDLYKTRRARVTNGDYVEETLVNWFSEHDAEEIERIFTETGVTFGRINTMDKVFAEPHFYARDMLPKVPDDVLGEVTLAGLVPKFLGTPGKIRHSSKQIGYDTERVLTTLCGYSKDEVSRLEAAGVVKCFSAESSAS